MIPHCFKKVRRYSKQVRTSVDRSQKSVQENQREEVPNTPPPQYIEVPLQTESSDSFLDNNITYPLLTKLAQHDIVIRRSRILWFLLEIIAVTFSADCLKIKEVLVKIDPHWARTLHIEDSSSIADVEARATITEFTALIRTLSKEMNHHRWLLVGIRDQDLIKKLVLEPVKDENLNLEYVLEIFGRYKRTEGCYRPESTLVDYWMSSSSSTDLGDAIASHVLLLQSLRLDSELHLVIEDSITTYQKARGLEGLRTSEELQEESILSLAETCCWPLSNVYIDLARGLRGMQAGCERHDPFGPSRTRLREKRKLHEP
jgi:hypothetical protein